MAEARSPELCWLPICNSNRSRPGCVEHEIYFRIVHLPQDVQSGAAVATYREQAVEIALGPASQFMAADARQRPSGR